MSNDEQSLNFFSHDYTIDKGLVGNVGYQPELLTAKDGTPYAKMTLYCQWENEQREKSDKQTSEDSSVSRQPNSLRIIVLFFGHIAKKAHEALNKGDFIAVYPSTLAIRQAVNTKNEEVQYRFLAKVNERECFRVLKSRRSEPDVFDSEWADGTA